MAEVKFIPIRDITVKEDRFRQTFTEKNLTGLQDSISSGLGLSNAITIKETGELITGESRLKAIAALHDIGLPAYYQGEKIPEGTIPAIKVASDYDELEYLEAELHENTQREGFTYIEEAQAIARIAAIRQAMLDKDKEAEKPEETKIKPKSGSIADMALASISRKAISDTASQVFEGKSGGYYDKQVKDSLTIVNALEKNPELGEKLLKAKTMADGQKILKKHAQEEQRTKLALEQGKQFSSNIHQVINGDCIEEMKKLPFASFDVCLTDPIYGINAGNFGDSAGRYNNFSHGYDDSLETFQKIMPEALKQVSRLLKDDAHLYLACDIRNYPALVEMINSISLPHNKWKVASAPFIQYKLSGGRVPHPGFTPRRSYEVWLYAYRGRKQELKLINDVIPCEADTHNTTHGASKPVELLKTFLTRSCMPGEKVLDFMAGSGAIIPACHELKLKCTAIELSETYYGECLERLKEL